MFWDCSWVQNNIVNGKNYGTHAFELLRSYTVPPTLPPATVPSTHAPTLTTRYTTKQTPTTQKPTAHQTTQPTIAGKFHRLKPSVPVSFFH